MKKIGNIIGGKANGDCWNAERVDGLPTLYVGFERAMTNIDGFDITRCVYDGDIWWAFARNERRKEHERVLSEFKAHCIRKAVEDVKYEYVDFPCYTEERVEAFRRYMASSDKKVCFITRGMGFLFIYSERYATVWGLSLSLCWYVGKEPKDVIASFKENKNNTFVGDTSFIDRQMRSVIGNDTHIIPVLHTYFCRK